MSLMRQIGGSMPYGSAFSAGLLGSHAAGRPFYDVIIDPCTDELIFAHPALVEDDTLEQLWSLWCVLIGQVCWRQTASFVPLGYFVPFRWSGVSACLSGC